MYGVMRIDDESTYGYYVVPWTSEPYTLQEDNDMRDFTPLVTAYAGDQQFHLLEFANQTI